ncbi:LAETG motif-containing sortase-dependent surface protein [Streptomyces sp. NPDC006540]|uniref:LAETG motif-containing sortase-dependent surface protein n=1 Tax=Streptomyces sp. NPDC006540 TaxID=3155353 RepID=UPI0033B45311
MTETRRTWRRTGALIAVASAGALGVGLSAAPAIAHTPVWSVTCDKVSVDLTAYSPTEENTVTITVDGKELLPTKTFKKEFHDKLDLPEHDKELTVRLVVVAGDGDQFSRDESKTAPVCDDATPSPTPSTTPPSPTPSETSPTPSETPSTSAPATSAPATSAPATPSAPPSTGTPGGGLAETGGSSATPVIAGARLCYKQGGDAIMWAARKRRSAQH